MELWNLLEYNETFSISTLVDHGYFSEIVVSAMMTPYINGTPSLGHYRTVVISLNHLAS